MKSLALSNMERAKVVAEREALLEEAVRNMLDEVPFSEDTCHTRALRRMLWNDKDEEERWSWEGPLED